MNKPIVVKQLKKNDFLATITESPMTREQLVDSLADYQFIPSYLDYLTDHFITAGKVVKNEDGTISRKPKKGSAPKEVFRVSVDSDGGHFLETKDNVGILSDADKESGWSVTENAAIKKASSAIFADYKEQTAAIKALATPKAEVKAAA